MRSESDGHCWPTSFPGLAAREAARREDLAPLILSVCDRYRPTVAEFLRHVDELRASSRWDESFRRKRIQRVRAVDGGFELDSHGVFRHVLLAPGHPGLAVPPELERDLRVVHAYQPHGYATRVAVVGAGMAAATEWLNALAAGAEVVSVRRREPARRPLNVPRPLFTSAGSPGSTLRPHPSAQSCCAASPSPRTRRAGRGTRRSSAPRARAASEWQRSSTVSTR